MKTGLKLTGVAVAACAACCAASVAPFLLAGVSAVLVGGAVVKWGAVAALLAVPAAALLWLSRRRAAPRANLGNLMMASGCGCGFCSAEAKQETPIACTLDAEALEAGIERPRRPASKKTSA